MLRVGFELSDACIIVYLVDDLTAYTEEGFLKWFRGIDYPCHHSYPIIINCHWIDDLDSSRLGSLVRIFKEVRDSGRSIALTGNKELARL